jgi:hypothetical protein
LALIIIYIYTIFGFLFFRDKFVQDDVFICESMLMCFVNVVNYGCGSPLPPTSTCAPARAVRTDP